jgi:hypothetical protein
MTFVAGECTQEGDLAMPIIETNEKLTRIIRGGSIELVIQEAGLVTIWARTLEGLEVRATNAIASEMVNIFIFTLFTSP